MDSQPDLEHIWEEGLNHMNHMRGTQMLLGQQGSPLEFDGQTFSIAVTAKWISTLELRRDLIGEALSRAAGKVVSIRFLPRVGPLKVVQPKPSAVGSQGKDPWDF